MLRKLFSQFPGAVTIDHAVKNLSCRAAHRLRTGLIGSEIDTGARPLHIRRYFFLVFGQASRDDWNSMRERRIHRAVSAIGDKQIHFGKTCSWGRKVVTRAFVGIS